MPIPKYYELYRPFLDCLKDGQPHSFAEVNDYIALVMGLTEEDIAKWYSIKILQHCRLDPYLLKKSRVN